MKNRLAIKISRFSSKQLIRIYISGSLVVLLVCLGATSLVLSSIFTNKERHRAQLTLAQLGNSINFHYRPIAEEFSTENYEAIGLRLAQVAQQFGGSKFNVHLVDESGKCVFATTSAVPNSAQCQTPETLASLIPALRASGDMSPVVKFDRDAGQYVYLAPLYLGSVCIGHLSATFSDPYDFFHGGSIAMAAQYFFPSMFLVLGFWLVWLIFSNSFILRPYFTPIHDATYRAGT